MRVLQIVEATEGGLGRHVMDLCEGLARRGVVVHLVYSPLRMDPLFADALQRCQAAGVRVVSIPMGRSVHPRDLETLLKLRAYIGAQGPFDLVHGHSSKGGGYARLLRVFGAGRAVYTPNAFVTLSPNIGGLKRLAYGLGERLLGSLTTALVAVSRDERREALRLGMQKQRVYLIPNGIRLDEDDLSGSKEEVRMQLGILPDETAIGFVGRFAPQKAPGLLLEAFAKVASRTPRVRLVMVGDGSLEAGLKDHARRLGIQDVVIWTGFLDGRRVMKAFDIFALPSVYEGFPYVLLEAMGAGVPVVTTAVGGTELAVENGKNGFVIPIGSVERLTEALELLCTDHRLRLKFSERSRQIVQQFNVDAMVDETFSLYQRLIS